MKAKALFKKAAKKTAKADKCAVPEFEDENLTTAIALFIDGKKMSKKADAQIKMAESMILPRAAEERNLACRVHGTYFSSIAAVAGSSKVTVSFPNNYSKISTDHEENLRNIYEDDYDKYFEEKTVATLNPVALEDENFIDAIVNAIGEDKFQLYFKVEQFINVKKEYHEQMPLNPALSDHHKKAYEAGLIKPTKASIKQS